MIKKSDLILAIIFGIATIVFIILMITNNNFFTWAWDRHHNILSWYIRPIMLLPYMYFAYKKKLSGMMFSVFALATSMAWFPKPETPSQNAIDFLAMEYEYLTQDITLSYILLWLLVPVVFILLGIAFWKRSIIMGGLVFLTSNVIKVIWSIVEGGESAATLIQAAVFGTIVTLLIIYFGYRRKKKKV